MITNNDNGMDRVSNHSSIKEKQFIIDNRPITEIEGVSVYSSIGSVSVVDDDDIPHSVEERRNIIDNHYKYRDPLYLSIAFRDVGVPLEQKHINLSNASITLCVDNKKFPVYLNNCEADITETAGEDGRFSIGVNAWVEWTPNPKYDIYEYGPDRIENILLELAPRLSINNMIVENQFVGERFDVDAIIERDSDACCIEKRHILYQLAEKRSDVDAIIDKNSDTGSVEKSRILYRLAKAMSDVDAKIDKNSDTGSVEKSRFLYR